MSKVRIYGDTSGYVDIAVPAVAGTTTLNLDKIPQADITTGNIAMDTDTLFVDAVNNRVGIGTATPGAKLHLDTASSGMPKIRFTHTNAGGDNFEIGTGVDGVSNGGWSIKDIDASATRFVINSSGNVGIGTTSPSQSIETTGNIFINSSANPFLEVKTSGAGNNPFIRIKADTNYWDLQTLFSNTDDELDFRYNGNSKLIINSSGNVGIGTTSPAQNLTVYNATASNFEVRSSNKFVGLNASSGYRPELWWQQGQDLGFGTATNGAGSGYDNKMIISSGGNVGIGTTNPTGLLDLEGSGATQYINSTSGNSNLLFQLNGTTTGSIEVGGGDSVYITANNASGHLWLRTGGANTRMFVSSGGNIGIATTSPLSGLHISDGTNAGSPQNASRKATLMIDAGATASADLQFMVRNGYASHIFFGDAADSNAGMLWYDHSTNHMNFTANTIHTMTIDDNGNVGIGTTSPGYKLQVDHGTTAQYVTSIRNTADNLQLLLGTTTGALLNIQGKTISSNAAYNIALQAEGGNVGIGTTGPTLDGSLAGLSINSSGSVVHINNTGNGATLKLTDPAAGANRGLGISLQGTEAVISNCESGALRFGTGNAERMKIDSSGNVIGQKYFESQNSSVAFYATTAGSYNQQNGPGGTAWAYGSTGGNSSPATQASTTFGFHHWNGSAWSNPLNLNYLGNIGIGTNSPAHKLHLHGTNPTIFVQGDSSSYYPHIKLSGLQGGLHLGTYHGGNITSENDFSIWTGSSSGDGGTRRLTILNSNGYVGINTATPQSQLDIVVPEDKVPLVVRSGGKSSIGYNAACVMHCHNSISSSGVYYDVCYVSHSPNIFILGSTVQNGSAHLGGSRYCGRMYGTYGSVVLTVFGGGTRTVAMNGGVITGMGYRYLNSGGSSGSYRLQVYVTWSGSVSSMEVYTTVMGNGSDTLQEDN